MKKWLFSCSRSDHSLSGLDSPLPPPPIRCCCIQGCVRKKAVLKDGRRPAVSAWQRYWIQLSGSNLLFYQPKHLRGYVWFPIMNFQILIVSLIWRSRSDRSDFRRRPFKAVSITGWSVERHHSPRHPDSLLLTNTLKGDAYKLRIVRTRLKIGWICWRWPLNRQLTIQTTPRISCLLNERRKSFMEYSMPNWFFDDPFFALAVSHQTLTLLRLGRPWHRSWYSMLDEISR